MDFGVTSTGGMKAIVGAEEASPAVEKLQARVHAKTDGSFAKVDCPDDVVLSRSEKWRRIVAVRRALVRYMRKMGPVQMLRKVRDCYVSSLGTCSQTYVSGYTTYHGTGFVCHASPLPRSLNGSMNGRGDIYGSEFCLSPAFRKSFNESLLKLKGSGVFVDSSPGATPFRKSFSDFESSLSPIMQRTYSDAASLYCSPRLRAGLRSPTWTPSRAFGGQALMIFPIQEAPELILASFRKEAHELRLASFRKDAAELGVSRRRDGDLSLLMEEAEEGTPAPFEFQVKEGLETTHATEQMLTDVELRI